MFSYPVSDNIINAFFDLAVSILGCKQLLKLEEIAGTVEEYQSRYNKNKHMFAFDCPLDDDFKPNKHQCQLNDCELTMLEALRLMLDYQRLQLGQKIDLGNFIFRREYMFFISNSTDIEINPPDNPAVLVIHKFIAVMAACLFADTVKNMSSDDFMRNLIDSGANMIRTLHSFNYSETSPTNISFAHIPREFERKVSDGMQIAIEDKQPGDSAIEQATFYLVCNMVDELIQTRQFHFASVKELEQYTAKDAEASKNRSHALQTSCHYISQIDAVLNFLNLSTQPDHRALLKAYLYRHHVTLKHIMNDDYLFDTRLPVVSSHIRQDHLAEDITMAASLLQHYLENAESILHGILILDYNKEKHALIYGQFTLYISNIYFDARFLIPLAGTLWSKEKGTDTKFLGVLQSLQNTMRMSAGLWFKFDSSKKDALRGIITNTNYSHVPLFRLTNTLQVSLACMMLSTKYEILLQECMNEKKRLHILSEARKELATLINLAKTNKDLFQSTPDNLRAHEFIMEFYLSVHQFCKTIREVDVFCDTHVIMSMAGLLFHAGKDQTYSFLTLCIYLSADRKVFPDPNQLSLATASEALINKIIEIVVNTVATLQAGKPKKLQLTYERESHRLSTNLSLFFFRLAKSITSYYMNKGSNKAWQAKCTLGARGLIQGKMYVNEALLMAAEKLSYDHTQHRPAGIGPESLPLMGLPEKKQFAAAVAESVAAVTTTRKTHKSKKSTNKKKTGVVNNNNTTEEKPRPDLEMGIEQIEEHFGKDKTGLLVFLQQALTNAGRKHKKSKAYALLGAARCLCEITDKDKARKLYDFIDLQSLMIFSEATQYFYTATLEELQNEFRKLMQAWQLEHLPPPKEAPKPEIAEAATVSVETPVRQAIITRKSQRQNSMHFFSEFQEPEKPKLPPREIVPVPEDEFEGIREHYSLKLDPIKPHEVVYQFLKQQGFDPKPHGGMIYDQLFGIEPGDLDLLCWAKSPQYLKKLLLKDTKRFFIDDEDSIRINKNSEVIVINFNREILPFVTKKTDWRLEIIVRPPTNNKKMDLIELGSRFGIPFFAYDRERQDVLDPNKLFKPLTRDLVYGIQVLRVDINSILRNYPSRILDNFKRIARVHKRNIKLKISPVLDEAMRTEKCHIFNPNVKQDIERFNKLFIHGYAYNVYLLLKEYQCLSILFPFLPEDLYASFALACMNIDIKMNDKNPYTMDNAEFEQLRAEFFADAFFQCFTRAHRIADYQIYPQTFSADCKAFIGQTCFETGYCKDMIRRVQNDWQKRLCVMHLTADDQLHQPPKTQTTFRMGL